MALAIDWLGIAEASANDARGALTLIGVGQNVVVAPQLPHREQRVLVISVLDENGSDLNGRDDGISLALEITSPSGRTLLANTQLVPLSQAANPARIPDDVESRGFQLVLTLNLEFTELGTHKISTTVIAGAVEARRERRLYVVAGPVLPQLPS